jgi:hypothetical protein
MDDCFDEFRRHMDDRFEELRRYMDVLHQEVLDALTVEAKGAPKLKARLPKLNAACAEELEND